jgi:lipopolysaccharide export system protein LptC
MNRRAVLIAGLALTALIGGWAAWLLRPPEPANDFVGPPRSDYTLDDYTLVVLNDLGTESFTTVGPYLARDPNTETVSMDKPDFSFPGKDGKGGDWTAHAEDGWVARKGLEVRLSRGVTMLGPASATAGPIHIATDHISVLPKPQTGHTDAAVTITRDGSILTGVGMNVDLKAHTLELLSNVRLHDAPAKRR